MTPDLASLVASVEKIRKAHSDTWPAPSDAYELWSEKRKKADGGAIDALTEIGADINNDWRGATLKLADMRSTSTSGIGGVMSNWLVKARRKIEGAAR